MIIVSQDRKTISNFANIVGIQINEHIENSDGEKDYEIIVITEKRECIIAVYETEERAKQVLQEIVKKYSSYLELKGGPAILQGQIDVQPNIFNIPKVYEMPKE